MARYEQTALWRDFGRMETTFYSTECQLKTFLESFYGRYKTGCLYNGICATRSSLSSVVMIPGYDRLSSHVLISRYIKGRVMQII